MVKIKEVIIKIKTINYFPYVWELFKVLSVGVGIFVLLEIIAPRSVLSVLNLTAGLAAWIFSAIIVILIKK